MILDNKLRNLKVGVKVGGSLVSHRVVFSGSEKEVFVISGSKILVYSTSTGLEIAEIQSPNADPIANITFIPRSIYSYGKDEDRYKILIIMTTTGLLAHIDTSSDEHSVLSVEDVNASMPIGWTKMSEWINMQCVDENKFLMLGRMESSDGEVMLYYVHRHLPGRIENVSRKKAFYEFDKICWQVQPTTQSICVGANGKLIGAIQDESLFVMDYASRKDKWHKSGTRKFTCVAAHPEQMVVATGDNSGRVLVWNNIFDRSPIKSTYHWHTLRVADLRFSASGTQMLSGGGECTLVNWIVQNASDRKMLPRMGFPIRRISVSSMNQFVAVSHADNCIQLVDSLNRIAATIQNITQCYIPEDCKDKASLPNQTYYRAGLHLDPRTNSLVMNGRPGQLQCYSFREDKHLYNLDITQQNFVTDERQKVIRNTDVTQVAFSNQGKWLATGETLLVSGKDGEEDKCSELRLKFWEFDKEKQRFVLNTSIDWPHENGLECLKIQETDDEDMSLMAATSGKDKLYKTWGIVNEGSNLHGKSYWWNCENAGSYRGLSAGPLAFSRDGSVLGVAFGPAVGLWTCDNHEFKGSLSHSRLQDDIKMMEFGCHMSSHLVICCSQKNIIVWDVISLLLTWTVPCEVDYLTMDPLTNTAAVFSSENHVFFFRPERSEPVAIHKNISRSAVASAVFVPNPQQGELNPLKSSLVFINSSQELCVFLPKDSEVKAKPIGNSLDDLSTLTPFTILMPEKRVSELVPKKDNELVKQMFYTGQAGTQIIREIMDASPHTMPSVTFFCDQLLASVSVPKDSSSDLLEMEKHLTSSFRKKSDAAHQSNALENESDDESDGEGGKHKPEESSSTEDVKQKNDDPETVIESEEIYDLEAVSSGNVEWIQSVFSS